MKRIPGSFRKNMMTAVALLLTVPGWSSVWFTSPDGTGSDCTQNSPCGLRTAMGSGSLNDGDTVYLSEGNYTYTNGGILPTVRIGKSISLLGGWDKAAAGSPVRNPREYVSIIDGEGKRRGILIDPDLNVTLDGFTVTNAFSDDRGAALYDENATALTLNDINFSSNRVENDTEGYLYGGAAYIRGGDIRITDCLFSKNSAMKGQYDSKGGGLYLADVNLTMENSILSENGAYDGSALYVYGDSVTVKHSRFDSNGRRMDVGHQMGFYPAVRFFVHSLTVSRSVFSANYTRSYYLFHAYADTAQLEGNRFADNSSQYDTVRLESIDSLLATNNIFVRNLSTSSTDEHSAVRIKGTKGRFINNTVSDNADIGILVGDDSDMRLINDIVTGQDEGIRIEIRSNVDADHLLLDNVQNLVTDSGSTAAVENNVTGDPAFANPSEGDYHIRFVSAARDTGADVNVTEDIDGDFRPAGKGYDIGADEFAGSAMQPALIHYLLQ